MQSIFLPWLIVAIAMMFLGLMIIFLSWQDRKMVPAGLILIVVLGFLSGNTHININYPADPDFLLKEENHTGIVNGVKKWGSWYQISIKIFDQGNDRLLTKSKTNALLKIHDSNIEKELSPGDLLNFNAKFKPIARRDSMGGFNERAYWAGQGIRYCDWLESSNILQINTGSQTQRIQTIARIRNGISEKINKLELTSDNKAIILAMLTGNKQKLTKELKQQFSRLGIMHLLAVSGLHAGLIFLIFSKIFNLFKIPEFSLLNRSLSSVLVWIYVIICGLPASAIRAASMISLHVISRGMHRCVSGVHIVFLVALIHTIYQPYAVFSSGFQLSYLAVLGILIFFPKIRSFLSVSQKIIAKLRDLAALSLSAQVFTLPVSIFIFASFPAWFLLANVILMPIGLFIFYYGLSLLFLAGLGLQVPVLEQLLDIIMSFWMNLGEKISNLPGSLIVFEEFPWMFLAMYAGIIILSSIGLKKLLIRPYSLLILFVIWSLHGFLITFYNKL